MVSLTVLLFSSLCTVFLIPASFTALIMLSYIPRFNLMPIYDKVRSLLYGKGLVDASHDDHERETEFLMSATAINAETVPLSDRATETDRISEENQEEARIPSMGTSYGSANLNDDGGDNHVSMIVIDKGEDHDVESLLRRATPAAHDHRKLYHISRTESRELRICSVLFFTLVLAVGVSLVLLITLIFQGFLSFLVFFTMLAMMCFILFMRYDDEIAGSMLGFFVMCVTLLGAIFIIGSVQMSGVKYTSSAVVGHYVNKTEHTYPICQEKWHGFDIIDYAFFSRLAYEPEPHFSQDFETWFPDLVEQGRVLSTGRIAP